MIIQPVTLTGAAICYRLVEEGCISGSVTIFESSLMRWRFSLQQDLMGWPGRRSMQEAEGSA